MTIGEATAFQRLMKSVVLEGDHAEEALTAAAYLADRAHDAVHAGPTGDQLRAQYADPS